MIVQQNIMQKAIELTVPQSELLADETSKAIAAVLGFGGGKTYSLVIKMIKIAHDHPSVDLLYIMPVYSMFRDVLFPTLAEILEGTGMKYKINKTTGEIFFDEGARIILKSADNPDTIVGINAFAVLLDELDTLPADKANLVWEKSLARARKKIHILDSEGNIQYDDKGDEIVYVNQLIVGTTPEGYKFVYNRFKKNKPKNYRLIQASGRTNVHLPQDYYSNLEAIYSKELVEAYIDGQFVNMATGAVYTEFNRISCDTDAIYRDGEELHISLDFNVNNMNGTVFVEREQVTIGNKLFQYEGHNSFHAIRHLKGIVDTPEMIQVIKNKYPRSPIYCYPDASGKNTSSKGFTTSDISLLKRAGFHCKYPNKNPRILERVQSVNSGFKTGLIKVNITLCPDIADALEQQVYNKNTELPEKTVGVSIDDINDSFGYFVHHKFPIRRRTIEAKKVIGF